MTNQAGSVHHSSTTQPGHHLQYYHQLPAANHLNPASAIHVTDNGVPLHLHQQINVSALQTAGLAAQGKLDHSDHHLINSATTQPQPKRLTASNGNCAPVGVPLDGGQKKTLTRLDG